MLSATHDLLLAHKPDDATHDASACSICTPELAAASNDTQAGGNVTTTDADVQALRSENADLLARITELEAFVAQARAEEQQRAQAEAQEQIASLQTQLDAAVARATAAEKAGQDLIAFLEAEKAKAEAEAEVARVRDERLEQVKKTGLFDEAHMQDNAERWARMDAEAFEACLSDWKQIAEKAGANKGAETAATVPATTGLKVEQAARKDEFDMFRKVISTAIGVKV